MEQISDAEIPGRAAACFDVQHDSVPPAGRFFATDQAKEEADKIAAQLKEEFQTAQELDQVHLMLEWDRQSGLIGPAIKALYLNQVHIRFNALSEMIQPISEAPAKPGFSSL